MLLSDIKSRVYDRLGYTSAPPTDVARRLLAYMNDAQREVARMRGMARFRRTILTCASVANSPFMVLPQAAVRLAGLTDRTSQKSLKEISIMDIRFRDPGLSRVDSNPDAYAIINMASMVAKQPSDASTLYIKSTVAETPTAYIEGITTGGLYRSTSVVLTGTTAVAFPGTDWIEVTKLFLSAATTGVVTLLEDSGAGTELARIGVGRTNARYTRLHLHGTPSQALTYYADVELHIEDLAVDGDQPFFLEDFHEAIVYGCLKREFFKREKMQEYAIANSEWKAVIGDMKAYARTNTDDGRSGRSQFSMLGSNFPAGT